MSAIKDRRFAAKAGVIMLIALAMACSVFVITGEPAFAKTAKPGKINASTVKRTDATQAAMTVSFGKAKNAAKYQVRYKKAGARKWKSVKTKKRTVTLKGLEYYTKYKVQVRGLAGKKAGGWTKAKTFTTLGELRALTFEAGENGELQEIETVKYLCAGEEIGEMPIPLVVNPEGVENLSFYYWTKAPESDDSVVKETMLMPDQDMTAYAYYGEGGASGAMFGLTDRGKILQFGKEKWIILDPFYTNGTPEDGALLLMAEEDSHKYIDAYSMFSNGAKWEGSRAQKWCTEFYRTTGGFSDVEKAGIIGVKTAETSEEQYEIPYKKQEFLTKYQGCSFDSTAGEKDKVFFLSAKEYLDYNRSYSKAMYIPTHESWLLRTPSAETDRYVAMVTDTGEIRSTKAQSRIALRPAINIAPEMFPGLVGSGTEEDPYSFCDQETADKMAADEVKAMIDALPEKELNDSVTSAEKKEIEKAIRAYNALTADQKKYIDKGALDKLKVLKEIVVGYCIEDETIYGNLSITNKEKIILENVEIQGNLYIENARSVNLKHVIVKGSSTEIYGTDDSRKCVLNVDDLDARIRINCRDIKSETMNKINMSSGSMRMQDSKVETMKNCYFYWSGSYSAALELVDTFITYMNHCEIRSLDTPALMITTFPGFIRTYESIYKMNDCYIWSARTAVSLSPYAYIETIMDSVLIGTAGDCVTGNRTDRPIRYISGNTIMYSRDGYVVNTSENNAGGYLKVDTFALGSVGTVRLYGGRGLNPDARITGRLSAPPGFHFANTDERYNTVSEDRLHSTADAQFAGKKFYYVIKDD